MTERIAARLRGLPCLSAFAHGVFRSGPIE